MTKIVTEKFAGRAASIWLLALGSSILANLPAHAAAEVGTYLQTWSTSPGSRPDGEAEFSRTTVLPSGTAQDAYAPGSGLGVAEAYARYGVMGVLVSRDSYAQGYQGFNLPARSRAAAHWFDTLQIDSPGRQGTTGQAFVTFTIDGTTTTSGSGFIADLHYRFAYGTATYDPGVGARVDGTGFLNTEQTQQIFFTFGTPFSLALTIEAAVEVNNAFAGSADVDLSHTQTWGGFESVSDGSGNSVPYSVTTSEGGALYSQAIVPEPASAAIAALGGLVLIARRRRK